MDSKLQAATLAKCTVLYIVEDAKGEEPKIKAEAAKLSNIKEVIVWDAKNKEKPTKKFQIVVIQMPSDRSAKDFDLWNQHYKNFTLKTLIVDE
jgi:hypothetical protein